MGNTPFSGLSDAQLQEALVKYAKVPSIMATLENEAKMRLEEGNKALEALEAQAKAEEAKLARQGEIAKIVKALGKVWTDDLTNVLVTREEVDDIEHGEEVEVNGVKETRYPKVKAIVVRTDIHWSDAKSTTPKQDKANTTTKRAITVSKRSGANANQLELVGHFRSGNEACNHLKLTIGGDSGNRVLAREGYFTEPYEGIDFTVAS